MSATVLDRDELRLFQARARSLRKALIACNQDRHRLLNDLVEMHIGRARTLACIRARHDSVLEEELVEAVLLALPELAQDYDPRRSGFWTYAQPRLLGRILMFFRAKRRLRREIPWGLLGEKVGLAELLPHCPESEARQWAARMLEEIGMLSKPAVDALMLITTRKEAAALLGISEDVFCGKLRTLRQTCAAQEFLDRWGEDGKP